MVVIGKMSKIKVLQQVLDPTGAGGVSAEYRALKNSRLNEMYDFQPMILNDFHSGLNLHDIMFYYRYIKKEKPDIIHVRGAAVDGLNAIIAAKIAHVGKILVTVHGMYSDLIYIAPIKKWISKNIIERLSFELADGISCVCKSAMEREYFEKYRDKMLPFVYNRMPKYELSKREKFRSEIREKYGISPKDIVGVYVGRMTKEKGLEILKRSLQELKKNWPEDFTMLLVGDGDYRIEMERMCMDISDRIFFAGNQKEVEKYYDAGDFFIQPSLHENHSIALLEACAAGLPCIATDCGGNAEIIDNGVTGILIPINDSIQLSKAIRKMCCVEIRNKYIKGISEANYSKFSDEVIDDALKNVYEELMRK